MSNLLVTGRWGEPHVTSAQQRNFNAGVVGSGCYVLSGLEATMTDANTCTVSPGVACFNGADVEVPAGGESVTIDNGTQGQLRNDLVVLRYQIDPSGQTESVSLVTVKGTPASSNPQDPDVNDGSILDGDSPVDMVLYRVPLNGVSVGDPQLVAETADAVMGSSSATGSVNSGWTVDDFDLVKSFGIVTCVMNISFTAGSQFAGVYASIPDGFRPAASLRVPATMAAAATVHAGYVEFRADGSVYINSGGATVIQAIACATWRAA